ncbi:hypothetical protein [Kutzneria kofuensis]|uniref:Uncharacterized protein n=1 Tax=Kutzneria kofuensis TaxID=103725 RepID=A0A7W9KFC6_9PSEU|nr:hypothetical protein [Kutzneria kofuensis]MBB5891568.1 hypothetical protein [Kutzneria kofuensis]
MAARQTQVRWVLILLVIGLVGIGAAVLVWWPTLGFPNTDAPSAVHTKATVVTSAQCGSANAHDTVEVTVDGGKKQVPLDGCGQAKGTSLDVVITGENGQLSAHPADAAQVGGNRDGRLTAVLLCLSAVAGALYAYLIRYQPVPKTATAAPAPVIGADEPEVLPEAPAEPAAVTDEEPAGEDDKVEENAEPSNTPAS